MSDDIRDDRSGPGEVGFAALRTAVLHLARGRFEPMSGADPELEAALHAIGTSLPPVRAEGPATCPPDRADGEPLNVLVLVRIDRFDAVTFRVGEQVAAGILSALRDKVLVAIKEARIGRLGNGIVEFTFPPKDMAEAGAALQALHGALEMPVVVDGEAFALPITVGASLIGEAMPIVQAVRQAEQALTRAEVEGSKLAIFCERERADASERLALMRDLRAGLSSNQLTLAYQPKLNVRTDRIDSVEALVRWRHPVRGNVAPDQFIELAEDTGDIRRITEQVLTLAIRDQAALVAAGNELSIYINLSGRLITDESFCRWMLDACATARGRIGVEITETAVIADPERALRNLHAIAEAGISIAIDDYGSGLSSLAYLKALPATELKIDKAFVLGLSSSHRDPLIVRSTIDLAHALQMEVTAEGVDDPTALALLRVMGCDRAQGYLISHPLDLTDLLVFLQEHADGHKQAAGITHPLFSLSRSK